MKRIEYLNKIKELYGNRFELLTEADEIVNRSTVQFKCNICGTILHPVSARHAIRHGTMECKYCHEQEIKANSQKELDKCNPGVWTILDYRAGIYKVRHNPCGNIIENKNINKFKTQKTCTYCGPKATFMKNVSELQEKLKDTLKISLTPEHKLDIQCLKDPSHHYVVSYNNLIKSKCRCKYCNGFVDRHLIEDVREEFSKSDRAALYKINDYIPVKYGNYYYKYRDIDVVFLPTGEHITVHRNDFLKRKTHVEQQWDNFHERVAIIEKDFDCKVVTKFSEYRKFTDNHYDYTCLKDKKFFKVRYDSAYEKFIILPNTLISRPIIEIMRYLNKNKVYFKREYSLNNLKNKILNKRTSARLDLYLINQNTFIEYDGKQHFYEVPFYSNNKEDYFKNRVYLDQLKNDYIKKKKGNLLRISYKTSLENCQKIVQDLLDNGLEYVKEHYSDEVYIIIDGKEFNKNLYYAPVLDVIEDIKASEKPLNCSGNPLEPDVLKD